ncbi:MAG: hypothetical protein LAP38_19160 [Acidobacteriia bacterium]|nr:hypothetical protein [Terriglobia bacterium]
MTIEVLATDPSSPAVLGKWDKFYVRVAYTSDRQIFVRARPFFAGKSVPSMSSGAMPHEAGSGEAFYWISYVDPRKVDSIVVTAESGRTTYAQTSIPVDLTWTGETSSSPQVPAEWAERMQSEQNRRVQAQSEAYMNRQPGLLETMLFFAAAWSVPAYFVAQIWTLWRFRGGWQAAASIPLLVMLPVLAYTVIAFKAGSNLFPIVLLFTAPVAFAYLLVILIVRRAANKATPPPQAHA